MKDLERSAWWQCLGAGSSAGLLLFAATAPGPFGALAFVALLPLLRVAIDASPAQAGWAGFACGLVWFGLGFLWVPWNVGGNVLWAAWVLGVPVLAAPLAAMTAALASIRRRWGVGVALVATPGAWLVIEHLRALGPLGVPWLRLGYAPADYPALIQLASLGGVGLVSAWIVAVNASVSFAIGSGRRSARVVPIATFAPVLAYGLAFLVLAPIDGSESLRIGVVQPAIPAEQRHVREHFDANLDRMMDLSAVAARGAPDLIAWPESAFELSFGAAGHPFLGSVARSLDLPLLAGGRRLAPAPGEQRWNTAALASPDGTTRVVGEKVRPLPIYERAPDSWLSRALAARGWWPGRVRPAREAGVAKVPLRNGGEADIGVLVCIDAAHPDVARSLRRRGAEVLVSISNEAETGSWPAAQHASLVRLRAVETRLPLVRIANTGPSVWVDPLGRELGRLGAGRAAAATAQLGAPLAVPTYVIWGDGPPLTALLLSPVALAAVRRRSRMARKGLAATPEEGAIRV